jgi:hypothetical protein
MCKGIGKQQQSEGHIKKVNFCFIILSSRIIYSSLLIVERLHKRHHLHWP